MTDQTKPDPFASQEAEFKAAVTKLHPEVKAAIAKVESEVVAVAEVVKPIALDTIEDVKAEAMLLEPRLKALLARIEDLAHTGSTNNPVYREVARLVQHVIGIAKSL